MQLPEPRRAGTLPARLTGRPTKAGPALEFIGGGLVLLGSFLPWASVATVFGTVSLNGIEGDGKITVVLGVVLVLIAVLGLTGSADTAWYRCSMTESSTSTAHLLIEIGGVKHQPGATVKDQPELHQASSDAGASSITRNRTGRRALGRNRTCGPRFRKPLLSPLSYEGMVRV